MFTTGGARLSGQKGSSLYAAVGADAGAASHPP